MNYSNPIGAAGAGITSATAGLAIGWNDQAKQQCEYEKLKDARRDRIAEAKALLDEEGKIAATECQQLRAERDAEIRKRADDIERYLRAEKELEELRTQRDCANRLMREAQHERDAARAAQDRMVMATFKLQAELADIRKRYAAERHNRLQRESASGRNECVPNWHIAEVPVNFVLDVNMPPDTLEIRNSNGQVVKITGIDAG